MASPAFVARDPQGARRVMAWLDAAPLSVLCDELEAAAEAPDLRPRLGELTCPTLVVTGTADAAVPPASVETIARAIPKAALARIEGAGHALLLEAPEKVVALVKDFLST
jgi:pimeloyl-ACP methyl ester carboxylesterase